jgi:hypothetical protein
MLTHRTFKGPNVVPRLLRLNARQIHLRRACWALGSYDNRRVCKRVFGKRHLKLPVYRREYRNSQPPTPGPRSLSVMCLTTLCSPRGTVQNGSLSRSVDNKSARQPCELFDTDSEKRSGSKLTNAGRLSSQKPPAPVHAVCVGTRPQRRQHLAGVFCLSVGEGATPDLAVARGAGV